MDDAYSTLVPSPNSSNSSSYIDGQCFDSTTTIRILTPYSVSNALLFLPLNTWVFWLGIRPTTTTRKTLTALLTSNLAALDICCSLLFILMMLGLFLDARPLLFTASVGCAMVVGRPLFYCCSCLERYLAVVHPLVYLRLRASRYRGLCPVLVWLLALLSVGSSIAYWPKVPLEPFFALILFTTLVMCFCSLSVLKALIRPGPGDVGEERVGRNQLKRRAFKTIVLIHGVVMVSFAGFLIAFSMMFAGMENEACVAIMLGHFLTFPSALVQPLLFLHKAGKLPRLCNRSESFNT